MQEAIEVKIKKLHPNAVIPSYAKEGDAGLDLTAITIKPGAETGKPYTEYGTGLSVEIPEGYVGLIYPRSSISNTPLTLANAVGVIDSGYRGEILFRFKIDGMSALIFSATGGLESKYINQLESVYGDKWDSYEIGDKIGQLIIMPYPKVSFIESEELSETVRGVGSYGSSGR